MNLTDNEIAMAIARVRHESPVHGTVLVDYIRSMWVEAQRISSECGSRDHTEKAFAAMAERFR